MACKCSHRIKCFRVEFIQLALEQKPLNLGQGVPDDLIPEYVIETMKEVVMEGTTQTTMHQYTRGHVRQLEAGLEWKWFHSET
jgi:aspartate/methionine/tyrosine aminotransferase